MAGFSFNTKPASSSSPSPSPFSFAPSSSTSIFSSNPSSSSSLFGSSAPSNRTFGAPSSSSSASSTSSFGFAFASFSSSTSSSAAASPAFGFGASSAPASGSTFGFGTSSPATASSFGGSSLFGSSSSSSGTTATTRSLFGSSSAFGASSLFGASSASPSSSTTATTSKSTFASASFGSSSPSSSGTTFGAFPSFASSSSSSSSTAASFPNLFGSSSSSSITSSSTPGFSSLSSSSSSSFTTAPTSSDPSFSFPAPSFSISTSSANSSVSAASATGLFAGSSSSPSSNSSSANVTASSGIRNLPPNVIQTILSLMPMRDAFRTSILSHNWRDHSLNIPKLMFDDAVFEGLTCKSVSMRWKLLYVVYPILLLHQGPILELSLCMSRLVSCCEIDQIILHLSRSATLKKFTLTIRSGDDHKLLPAFFKLQQLMILELQNCAFQPPVTFKGFSRLVSLSFNNVSMTAEAFLLFISNCPQLKDFTLIGDEKHLMGCWNSDFVELFECLPLVVNLCMSWYPIKCFATGVMPQKLPTSLIHLNWLHLVGLSFAREIDLQAALLLVTSSPNIETIVMEMQHNPKVAMSQTAMNFIEHGDYSYVILDHLRVIQITNFTNMKTGMDFVKLILAKSPMLKEVYIVIDKRVDVYGEVKMLKELLLYPRASTRAEIRIKRP